MAPFPEYVPEPIKYAVRKPDQARDRPNWRGTTIPKATPV